MNQIINAYYQITFAEWNWVFIDGVWPIVLAYTLPLSNAARKLPRTRPTASILGLQTVSSVVGMIFFNLIFTFMALGMLSRQPWYECRKWVPTDLLNALVIGDNYESEVIFLVTGAQYLSTGIALNFGYEFRRSWLHNYHFVACITIFFLIHTWINFVPSKLSCFFRVNCENENAVRGVTGGGEVIPIQNAFNTTLMPEGFDFKIFAIIVFNTVIVSCYEYYVVNGIRRQGAGKKRGYENSTFNDNASQTPSVEVTDHIV
jgi:magnesium-transporting ATPase (P-type)